MLPLKINSTAPYLRNNLRLTLLQSGSKFGETNLPEEHMYERLNNFVETVNNPEKFDQIFAGYESMRTVPYPDLSFTRPPVLNRPSDIMLKDSYRQHRAIEERHRKSLPNSRDIRLINDWHSKEVFAGSRGLEREIVEMIARIDAEFLSRS